MPPLAIKFQFYLSYVRSLLEYFTKWSPYQVNEIMRIKRFQRHVTKFILNEYSSDVSYRDRCLTLVILPMCYRGEILNLCFLFKCLHGEIDININTYLQFVQSNTSRRSANKGTLFYLKMTKTVQAQYMSFNRLARLWNKLPQHIRISDSLSSFKRQLGGLYKTHAILRLAVDEPPYLTFISMYILCFGSVTALRADASRWFLY